MSIEIRLAADKDSDVIWSIFSQIVSLGDTYAFSPQTTREEALYAWFQMPQATYVAELQGQVVGTYYIKANQPGQGSHVCNCGYMVGEKARGKGIATLMCEHSQQQAKSLGFLAMQFNLVVASNEKAVRLWEKLGFAIVGTLPKAFQHQKLGFVDAYVMYKWL